MRRNPLALLLCLLAGCGPAGRLPGDDITSIWKPSEVPRRDALRRQDGRAPPPLDGEDLASIWKKPGAARQGNLAALRAQQPLAIYLSALPPERVGKDGRVFEVVVRNNTDRTLFLDRRCLWPPLAMEAKLRSGKALPCAMAPAPRPVFAEHYVLSLQSGRDIRLQVAPGQFLMPYNYVVRSGEGGPLDIDAMVCVTFRYSLSNLAGIGIDGKDYPRDKGMWVHETTSNVLLMKVRKLLQLYRMSLKASGGSPDGRTVHWYF